MPTPTERLALALEALEALQAQGRHAIRSRDLSRAHRELLLKQGFLQEVMKGWYIAARPDVGVGESTAWYASYWDFCRDYLTERFDADWSLSPEQSLVLHGGNWNVPQQLLVRARRGGNEVINFLHGTSLLDAKLTPVRPGDATELSGLRLYSPTAALINASAQVFLSYPTEARTILGLQRDASDLLVRLLEGGHSVIAGRLAGAFRNVGRDREADEILGAMRSAGYDVREKDPFEAQLPRTEYRREPSPYVHRIRLLWQKMRPDIQGRFPVPPPPSNDIDAYLRAVDDIYVTDAYHSLSIEGYRVDRGLIERVRSGAWNPDANDADRTVRHLTLASKQQQKDWLALLDDPNAYAPMGQNLKAWLFGGQSISTKVGLFPLDQYAGQIVADLFGEESYFADTEQFWSLQNQAVAARCDALREAGWIAVSVLESGQRFTPWDYEKTPMKKGGKAFIAVLPNGEVEVHEGYLPANEARRARALSAKSGAAKGADAPATKAGRPETTSSLQDYIDLHRHAAVRDTLADEPSVALRLMVAHAITGSVLWKVEPELQQTRNAEVAQSVASSASQLRFAEKRRAVLALLDLPPDAGALVGGNGDGYGVVALFARLLALTDDDVLRVVAVVMGETLKAGSAAVEVAGVHLGVDLRADWRADEAFFDLIRDREVANAMLREVAGRVVADSNLTETVKVQKGIIRDHVDGAHGRPKALDWTPAWLRFPVAGYTDRPFATRDKWQSVATLFARSPRAQTPQSIAAE